MNAIQLEFQIDAEEDVRFSNMKKQIDALNDSMGKVRRKLFAELTEIKKLYTALKIENESMRSILSEMNHEKTQWAYGQNGCLFDVQENT